MNYNKKMHSLTHRAKESVKVLCDMSEEQKNLLLKSMALNIRSNANKIKAANKIDLERARKKNLGSAFIDRLELTEKRIEGMARMLEDVSELPDPTGKIIDETVRPNGLVISKVRVPIGVIGIIFESRPNVAAECVGLCLKSGNAVILRGGSAAINSNSAICEVLNEAVKQKNCPELFFLLKDTSREYVQAMLKAVGGIDLIMPRGGESLINMVVKESLIPVIKHYKGVCHVYVDSEADIDMAVEICVNAKVQRPGVCNAMETMLVHSKIAHNFLPKIFPEFKNAGVELRGCGQTISVLGKDVIAAKEEDYDKEWLDLILSIKIVSNSEEAVEHISRHGSGHSDAIITKNPDAAEFFLRKVDSAAVYHNASTRFTDGGEFGKGAEIGISTDKLHARGPMGLEELTTYKYVIKGKGQIRT